MADISITAANVAASSNAVFVRDFKAGATITAGQVVYLDTSTTPPTWKLGDANGSGTRRPTGIALHASLAGQPLVVQTGGDITIGATLTAGLTYYLSDTAGGICPVADIGSGEDVVLIGIAKSTTVMNLIFNAPGVTL